MRLLYLVSAACPSRIEAARGFELVSGEGGVEGGDAVLCAPGLGVGKLLQGLLWVEAAGTKETAGGRRARTRAHTRLSLDVVGDGHKDGIRV